MAVHIARGFAVAAMFEYTHRVAGEQEVPDELVVLLGELGEAVADDDGPAEGGGGALLADRVEFGGVVAQVVQLAGAAARVHDAGQRFDSGRAFGGGRIEPALLAALFERGQHRVRHRFGVLVFVDHRHLHVSHSKAGDRPEQDLRYPPHVCRANPRSDRGIDPLTSRQRGKPSTRPRIHPAERPSARQTLGQTGGSPR